MTRFGTNLTTNASMTVVEYSEPASTRLVYGFDPAQEKAKQMTLEEIAARLDELSLDYDWPELVALSEEIGRVSEAQEHKINRLTQENETLQKETHRLRDPRLSARDRMTYEEQHRRMMIDQRYGLMVNSPTSPQAIYGSVV